MQDGVYCTCRQGIIALDATPCRMVYIVHVDRALLHGMPPHAGWCILTGHYCTGCHPMQDGVYCTCRQGIIARDATPCRVVYIVHVDRALSVAITCVI